MFTHARMFAVPMGERDTVVLNSPVTDPQTSSPPVSDDPGSSSDRTVPVSPERDLRSAVDSDTEPIVTDLDANFSQLIRSTALPDWCHRLTHPSATPTTARVQDNNQGDQTP